MFHWTETDVSNLIKFVVESVRTSGKGFPGAARERLIAAVAAELGAASWRVRIGQVDLVNEQQGPNWVSGAAEAEREWDSADFEITYGPLIDRLRKLVTEYRCGCDEISARKSFAPHQGPQNVIAWVAVRPDGSCECIEFCKNLADGDFTARDEAILRVLSNELLAQSQPASLEADGQVTAESLRLPPRQREVLASLLSGSSVKEIAGELGISPYTVNDYIKAIYRRYKVCSRGELLAAVHGLRKHTVPR